MGAAVLVHAESSKAVCRHAVGSGDDASDRPLNVFQVAFVGVKNVSAQTVRHDSTKDSKRTRRRSSRMDSPRIKAGYSDSQKFFLNSKYFDLDARVGPTADKAQSLRYCIELHAVQDDIRKSIWQTSASDTPGFTFAGHRTMNGTRVPPSKLLYLPPRNGPAGLWPSSLATASSL